jgi:hypothetical protein
MFGTKRQAKKKHQEAIYAPKFQMHAKRAKKKGVSELLKKEGDIPMFGLR